MSHHRRHHPHEDPHQRNWNATTTTNRAPTIIPTTTNSVRTTSTPVVVAVAPASIRQSSLPSSFVPPPQYHHQQQQPQQQQQQQPVMERLLYNLHYKCCNYALHTTSRTSRFYAEHIILIIAICCFGALLLSHRTFVFYPSSSYNIHHHHSRHYIPTQCLASIPGFIADTDIVDVTHLILIDGSGDDDDDDDNNNNNNNKNTGSSSYSIIIHNDKRRGEHYNKTTSVQTTPNEPPASCLSSSVQQQPQQGEEPNGKCIRHSDDGTDVTSKQLNQRTTNNQIIMFSYAREKGYLFLSSSTTNHNNNNGKAVLPISTQYVYISKHDSQCFAEPFVQYLIFTLSPIFGPDTVMINWLLGTFYHPPRSATTTTATGGSSHTQYTAQPYHSGYIYNPRTRVVIDIEEYKQQQTQYRKNNNNNSYYSRIRQKLYELSLKFMIVIKTSFLFFITTTLVSFTIRETLGRMILFTHTYTRHYDNSNFINSNNNSHSTQQQRHPLQHYHVIVPLIMTHVMENVIFVPIILGFIYFLINFYTGNEFLAFSIFSLVWICESFSMVSLRTKQGVQYFPLFFYFLFALFHYYHISFPYGFSYAALATSTCFMMHSMLFFWHRYELPAVLLGRVNHDYYRSVSYTNTPTVGGYNTPIPSPPMVPSMSLTDSRNTPDETIDPSPPMSLPPPSVSLPNFERVSVGRMPSFNTVASGRLSRNSSNNGMYNRGDEDDEGSCMYFMGGEVVIPRHHNNDHTNSNSDHSRQRAISPYNTTDEFIPPPTNPTLRAESVSSSLSLSSDVTVSHGVIGNSESSRSSRRERFVNELEPVVASAFSMDDDAEFVRGGGGTHDVTPDSASQVSQSIPQTSLVAGQNLQEDPYSGESNSSALRAILNVMEDIDATDTCKVDNGSSTTHIDSIFR